MSTDRREVTIGLLSPYFGLFDEAMPLGFRDDRRDHADKVRDLLRDFGDVVFPGMVDSDEAAISVGEQLSDRKLDVIVCAPTMAAPPSYTWEVLKRVNRAPVVILGIQESQRVPSDYDTEEATRRSLPVGVVMTTNVLVRQGFPFISVIGSWDHPDLSRRIEAAMLGAVAASKVRGARLLAVGSPIDGYSDIEVSAEDLSRLEIEVVDVSAQRLGDVFDSIESEAVEEEAIVAQSSSVASAVEGDVLRRSVRLTCALRELCVGENVAGGAVNCHGDHLRWNPQVGITACLGVSRLTEEGRPFACTGDIPTSIALILGKQVAGAALYCELYQLDLAEDWILVANGGEGDLSMRDRDRPVRLLPEDHYMGIEGPGTAVAFSLPEGPATLFSLTPLPAAAGGWRLIVAQGAIVGSEHESMEGPNGMFRFDSGDVESAYRRWCEAGATHHAALLPGHQARPLRDSSHLLGIEIVEV